ncbi:SGNH/GDSL hydrolase family protein [Streptomyces pimonensis]|uniref:SGNH/GDSL hydrolase family protein n=1 Tax=Streptomyces pimonensis TaxID=2860288 RepID=A0ABV4J1X9_9ACTN
MRSSMDRTGPRARRRTIGLATAALLLTGLALPGTASATGLAPVTLISEDFDDPTGSTDFGFPTGAGTGDGVLHLTDGMRSYTTSVKRFPSSIREETTLDLRFDWSTAIADPAMKTGLELRDDDGRLVFAIASTATELRYAVTGPDSTSASATDDLNPVWNRTPFDSSKWFTVDLHMDFSVGTLQYAITTKEAAPRVMASGTEDITGTNLAKFVACNYYGTGTQSIDDFSLSRPAHSAQGSLAGTSVYAFGDSIVQGNGYARGFVDFVAERERISLTKYSRNGATLGPAPDAHGGQIISQVRRAVAQAPDVIVFDGGTNDASEIHDNRTYELGQVGDSLDPADLDTGTYAGALEATVHAMREKWPTSRIVYVTTHKLVSRDWQTQLALREVTLRAAEKWGVTVADVFGDTTLDTRIDAQRVAYTFNGRDANGFPTSNGSGTHPNITAITEFYVPVLTARLVRPDDR